MSNTPKVLSYKTIQKLTTRLRDDCNNVAFVLLYAYNGTGKTRLSMAFKEEGKRKHGSADTLYFNAFTEDLFFWDNDLDNDAERVLQINSHSKFFDGFKELALESKISAYLERYAKFDFKIDYEHWTVSFSRGDADHIKVSRGEESLFIWCVFLAICQLVVDGEDSYAWVKYLYIDDPISSLDDNNAIAVATDLAKLLREGVGQVKVVVSSHHGLFFNVMCNEVKQIKGVKHKSYFLHHTDEAAYTLRSTKDVPFFQHVAILSELQHASETGRIFTHHFNALRSVLEKTASFFGYQDFSVCLQGDDDDGLYSRALNLLSHGQYSIYEPREMGEDNKDLFRNILQTFLTQYQFQLPAIFAAQNK